MPFLDRGKVEERLTKMGMAPPKIQMHAIRNVTFVRFDIGEKDCEKRVGNRMACNAGVGYHEINIA